MGLPLDSSADPQALDRRNLVIKLKYGNTLRRIGWLLTDHDTSRLRAKIVTLFNFKPNTDFDLTYTDKENNIVVIGDDVDMYSAVVCQHLNPLRISVTLRSVTAIATVSIHGQLMESDMSILRAKIVGLCRLDPNSDIFLTYTDEDSDVVTLEDNDELRDVVAQHLHPLKIDVVSRSSVTRGTNGVSSFFEEMGKSMPGPFNPYPDLPEMSDCVDCPRKKGWKKGREIYRDRVVVEKFGKPSMTYSFQRNRDGKASCYVESGARRRILQNEAMLQNRVTSMRQISAGHRSHGALSRDDRFCRDTLGPSPLPSLGLSPLPSPLPLDDQFRRNAPHQFLYNHPKAQFVPLMLPPPPRISDVVAPCLGCGVSPIAGPSIRKPEGRRFWYPCISGTGNEDHHSGIEPNSNLSSSCVNDVPAADGAMVAPSAFFVKIWRVQNNGNACWPSGTQIVWVGGHMLEHLRDNLLVLAGGLAVKEAFDITVGFVAPPQPGQYTSYWRLATPSGQQFGERLRVFVHVSLLYAKSWKPSCHSVCNEISLPRTSWTISPRRTSWNARTDCNARRFSWSKLKKVKPVRASFVSVDDATPSASSVDDAPPSASSVDDAVPFASVDEALPSASSVDVALPSASSVDVALPSTSSVDDSLLSGDDALRSELSVDDALLSASVDESLQFASTSVHDALQSATSVDDALPSASVDELLQSASVDDAPQSAPSVDDALPSASVDDAPQSEPSVDDAHVSNSVDVELLAFVASAGAVNETECECFTEWMLLKRLEEMGFEDGELNRQILRKNNYDLNECVRELCDLADDDWDLLHDELQEMGFAGSGADKS